MASSALRPRAAASTLPEQSSRIAGNRLSMVLSPYSVSVAWYSCA